MTRLLHGRARQRPRVTLVMAGRDDVAAQPEHQGQLAAAIPHARLQIVERAGHEPYSERPAEVMAAIRNFISADAAAA